MENYFSATDYWWARLVFERSLAAIYFIAFISAFNQFPALLGERGLLPVPQYLRYVSFKQSPSLFHWKYSDQLFEGLTLVGASIAILFVFGFFASIPVWLHILLWLMMYAIYLSIVNVGQDFYGFGWESMLLEAGFFAAFMGPQWVTPSWIPIIIVRWMLFRTEFGAGMIKLRGDQCWRDLTCLYYHHETQPLPNALSRYFHFSPKIIHRGGVVFSHFVQLIVPFGLFFPQPFAAIAGALIIIHQLILVISGNYSWLNWLTIVLAVLTFSSPQYPELTMRPLYFEIILGIVALLALVLSYRPLKNLISPRQYMNFCWNRFHLVCAYGAFGSVTKKRYEIVIEGTTDSEITSQTIWKEYGFKGKPGALNRTPPVIAPYHLRLDWMIWFLPFTVQVQGRDIRVLGYEEWFIKFMEKLLVGDQELLALLKSNPFPDRVPKFIQAKFYLYQFTTHEEFKQTGNYWKRSMLDFYMPPISL